MKNNANHEIQLSKWAEIIATANASGLTRKEWCLENSISVRQFYYWQSQVRKKAMNQSHETLSSLEKANSIASSDAQSQSQLPSFYEIPLHSSDTPTQFISQNKSFCDTSVFVPELVVSIGSFQLLVNQSTSEETLMKVISVCSHA